MHLQSDSLLQLLGAALHAAPWWLSRQAVVAGLGFGVALPLSLPRRLGAIAGEEAGRQAGRKGRTAHD